jgi:hypothetical protein
VDEETTCATSIHLDMAEATFVVKTFDSACVNLNQTQIELPFVKCRMEQRKRPLAPGAYPNAGGPLSQRRSVVDDTLFAANLV